MLDSEQCMSGDDDQLPQLPTFAARLRWARERKGLSSKELAAEVGREPKTIYRYEGGDEALKRGQAPAMPSRNTLRRLATAVGAPPDWLEYGRRLPGLREVEEYLRSPDGLNVSTQIADALREMPWATMGMDRPTPEQVREVRIVLELLARGARQNSDGGKGG